MKISRLLHRPQPAPRIEDACRLAADRFIKGAAGERQRAVLADTLRAFDPERLEALRGYGVRVLFGEPPPGTRAIYRPRTKELLIDPSDDDQRMRFLVLHELGHAFDGLIARERYGVDKRSVSLLDPTFTSIFHGAVARKRVAQAAAFRESRPNAVFRGALVLPGPIGETLRVVLGSDADTFRYQRPQAAHLDETVPLTDGREARVTGDGQEEQVVLPHDATATDITFTEHPFMQRAADEYFAEGVRAFHQSPQTRQTLQREDPQLYGYIAGTNVSADPG